MKLLPISLSILLTFVFTLHAEDAASLPALPDVQTQSTAPEMNLPESTRSLPTTNTPTQRMRQVTQEQIDEANKDKNWLTEGLKEKELKAETLRQEEAKNQKTIIDEILERNQQQVSALNSNTSQNGQMADENGKMKAAISTSAWEPLPDMQSSQYAAAMGNTNSNKNETDGYQKFDEKTGIANVFFNPATGNFDSQPVDTNAKLTNRPQQIQPWQQQQQNSLADSEPEAKEVAAFEARLVEQARAQNRLPENYQNPSLRVEEDSPYLLANNGNSSSFNFEFQNGQNPNATQSGYANSVAKMRMVEEERQRKLADEKRFKPINMHTPFQGKGIEINPRF